MELQLHKFKEATGLPATLEAGELEDGTAVDPSFSGRFIITGTLSEGLNRQLFEARGQLQVFGIFRHASCIDRELRALADEWRQDRGPTSSALRAAMHPAYLRIIGKGSRAVPFLLRELERNPDHWFLALMAITGEDPVPEEARGNIQAMADAWVQWGKRAQII